MAISNENKIVTAVIPKQLMEEFKDKIKDIEISKLSVSRVIYLLVEEYVSDRKILRGGRMSDDHMPEDDEILVIEDFEGDDWVDY